MRCKVQAGISDGLEGTLRIMRLGGASGLVGLISVDCICIRVLFGASVVECALMLVSKSSEFLLLIIEFEIIEELRC